MKRLEEFKSTEVYAYDKDHYIDIIETNESYEAWLFNRTYGFKSYMYSVDISQMNKEEFINKVTEIALEHIPLYEELLCSFEKDS